MIRWGFPCPGVLGSIQLGLSGPARESPAKHEEMIMSRDPRYDILFEPVRIGPVTAKNRFYQVPHCTGAGYRFPHTVARLRGIKAEGGWGVVNTEWCSVHPSMDTTPTSSARLWTDEDVRTNALMTVAVHEHGALAGCQLAHSGLYGHNRYSRLPTMGPSPRPLQLPQDFPGQGRAMRKSDIRAVRQWHRIAVRRAIQAGFDLVYVYASHGVTVFTDFLSPRINQRTDEYGGSLENRVRFLRETLETVLEEADGRMAVALRFYVDEGVVGGFSAEDGRATVEMLAEMPDLWDVNTAGSDDMLGSRYRKEGWQAPGVEFVKQVTTKPVVGVGRFTSPDSMVSMVKKGVLDLIGAARPSIADPFIPKKIEEGREEDIRECIGCNVCLASNAITVPIRCTQNPAMAEEWRRGWHPETIQPAASTNKVLVIGAGPAGLEAARAAGQRGYEVALAESTRELGGHLNAFAKLPGFAEWLRVRDWRVGQIQKMANVSVYLDSELTVEHVVEFGYEHVIVATGSVWRRDGVGANNYFPIIGHDRPHVLTPDDVLAGAEVISPVVVFDDDTYVMGGALAEMLAAQGHQVTLVSPQTRVSTWTQYTMDQQRVHRQLVAYGAGVLLNNNLAEIGVDFVRIAGNYGETPIEQGAATVILVTMRAPNDILEQRLSASLEEHTSSVIDSVTTVGDCLAPGLVSEAVFSGHKAARDLDTESKLSDLPFRVEQVPASFAVDLPAWMWAEK